MSRILRSLPPAGTAIGLAFSGGLDTRAAVAWMSRQGLQVHAYTADLAQPDEANVADIPPMAMSHGAAAAKVVDARHALVTLGQCLGSAFRLSGAAHSGTWMHLVPRRLCSSSRS